MSADENESSLADVIQIGNANTALYGRRLSVNVALDVGEAIEEIAARHQISITEVIRRAVSAYKYIDDDKADGVTFFAKRGDSVTQVTFL